MKRLLSIFALTILASCQTKTKKELTLQEQKEIWQALSDLSAAQLAESRSKETANVIAASTRLNSMLEEYRNKGCSVTQDEKKELKCDDPKPTPAPLSQNNEQLKKMKEKK